MVKKGLGDLLCPAGMGLSNVMLLLTILISVIPLYRCNVTIVKDDEFLFNAERSIFLPKDTGNYFCFSNRVSCVEYHYDASHEIISFVALRQNIETQTPKVNSVQVLENSVHIGKRTEKRIKLDLPSGEYCVVFLNGKMNNPPFDSSNHSSDVSMVVSIKGCPTAFQKLAAILIPISIVFAIGCCFSAMWIRQRRRAVKKRKQQHKNTQVGPVVMGMYTPSPQANAQMMPSPYPPQSYYPGHYPSPQAPPVQGVAQAAATVIYPSVNAPGILPAGMNNAPNMYDTHQSQPQSTTPYTHGLQHMDGSKPVQDSETAI